ncbi:ShlB/FhaC/HecB family hemolysin secretion/activation protein [Bosea lathyri]|uniref:Hemolysin activation/secretion protein n=1 Tax=Bosea lathyri TaxID=1036778 RepID=A0A1H6CIH2_9HYPH|nr:ShlB/FhaC/HecB family hemolysin secretion/activation protein [Bosea lathyri]SEG72821.1 Hemolysin activation/secretion protein [Bosea lathyri]
MTARRVLRRLCATFLILGLGVPAAFAQTASQITPATVRPQARAALSEVVVPELSGPDAPKGAERLKVRLAGVVIGGGGFDAADASVAAARAAFGEALTNQTVTVAQIFAAARALEAAYGQSGYVLTRVVVPAQSLKHGGTLKIVVIDGFIERIETKDVPEPVKSRIEAVLAPIVGRTSLRLAEIERALVLAGDAPGTLLKSTLAAGKQPGSSMLVVEARYKPVTGSLSIDNTLGPSLGRVNPALALQLNSAFRLGEQLYVQVAGYPDLSGSHGFFRSNPTNRQLAVGMVLPLGADGWSANIEAIRTDTAPNASAGQQFYSQFERFSARLKYAVVRSRSFNLSSELAFDAEQETLSLVVPVAAPLSLDRLRVLRSTTEISGLTPGGAFMSGRVIASLGIDGLGARDAAGATAELPLSRQGADASFGKLELSGRYSQLLAEHLGLDLFARAQTSFGKPLPRAEQIGIVGSNALSTFDAGTFQGDSGIVGRAELSSPWAVDLGTGAASVSPYAFGAIGSVWLMQPTSVERRQVTAGSFGLGIRFGAAPNPPGSPQTNDLSGFIAQAALSLEWGHQYRNDGRAAADRFTISSALQF